MADALSLVRNATITKKPVNYQDNHYIFDNQKLHENTKTIFKRTLQRGIYDIFLYAYFVNIIYSF